MDRKKWWLGWTMGSFGSMPALRMDLSEVRYTLNLTAPATALAIGQLDDDFPFDLAWVSGSRLGILHGQDQIALGQLQPQVETIDLGFNATDLALGDFIAGNSQTLEIAVLSSAGDLHLYGPGGQALPGGSDLFNRPGCR